MPFILGTNSIKDTGYNVDNSLRFNDGSSDYLNKTASAGNRRTFTFSTWLKLSQLTTARYLFTSWSANNDAGFTYLAITDGDKIKFAGYGTTYLETNQLLRDPSSWYHLMLAVDTTNGTANNRCRIYLNGSEITSFGTRNNPSQNADLAYNQNNVDLVLGSNNYGGSKGNYYDGYLAETVLIDGSQLAADSFGEFDSNSPTIWKPIDVSGLTFGTNGFYLEFKQAGTSQNSSGLGADTSGNDNHFAVNNLTAVDQTTDTCTNNFATLNPLDFTGSITASEGNTVFQGGRYRATFGVSAGKWYWEAKRLNAPDNAYIGIKADDGDWSSTWSESYTYYTSNGNYYLNGSDQGSYGTSSTTNDILIFALDMDNGKFYVGENGTFYNSGNPATGSNPMASSISGTYLPTVINNTSDGTDQYSFNFGNPSFSISTGNADANGFGNFEYAVPSGFFSLCSKNLAEFG
jgi:hypothetical protein